MSNPLNDILTDEEYTIRVKQEKERLIEQGGFKEGDAENMMKSAIEFVKASCEDI